MPFEAGFDPGLRSRRVRLHSQVLDALVAFSLLVVDLDHVQDLQCAIRDDFCRIATK
jgi:hypothetical protein